jgi:hypothetical protein
MNLPPSAHHWQRLEAVNFCHAPIVGCHYVWPVIRPAIGWPGGARPEPTPESLATAATVLNQKKSSCVRTNGFALAPPTKEAFRRQTASANHRLRSATLPTFQPPSSIKYSSLPLFDASSAARFKQPQTSVRSIAARRMRQVESGVRVPAEATVPTRVALSAESLSMAGPERTNARQAGSAEESLPLRGSAFVTQALMH